MVVGERDEVLSRVVTLPVRSMRVWSAHKLRTALGE